MYEELEKLFYSDKIIQPGYKTIQILISEVVNSYEKIELLKIYYSSKKKEKIIK